MMRTFACMLTILFVAALYDGAAVLAQSSGSFSASYAATQCSIADNSGALSPGIAGNSLPEVQVKVSSGNGVALVITPSLVTGLYTQNKLSQLTPTATQHVGLRVKVLVGNSTAGVVPEITNNSSGVIYDQRFIQVSSTFLGALTACLTDCFSLVMSTLSAHSFNFYVSNLAPGTHTIKVMWDMVGGGNGEGVCVGPGTLTVEQVKNFNFTTGIK